MSLNTVASPAGQDPAQQTASLQNNWQNVLGGAAKALGMSTGSVSAQLRAGASLSSIAQAQGVPQQALTDAIASALSPSTQAASTSAERQQIASSIANRAGGGHGHHAHRGESAASTEGADQLFSGLEGGAVSVSITSADVLVVLTGGAASTPSTPAVDELA